jgi:LemA protein
MQARDALKRRPDVDDDDIDDIIGIAAELQDAERQAAGRVTQQEVEDVARELDIDPAYVDQAIRALAERRAQAKADQAEQEAQAAAKRKQLGMAGAGVAGLALLAALAVGGMGMSGASQVRAAQAEVAQAEAALDVVLERQASLLPQLVAMAGGQSNPDLDALSTQVREAPTVDERLKASDILARELAAALGALPTSADPAVNQQRMELQYEVTGSQNRISTELRRYRAAEAELETVRLGTGPRIADSLGLTD